jgi:aspartate/methionine/tyrosine aminotransferase
MISKYHFIRKEANDGAAALFAFVALWYTYKLRKNQRDNNDENSDDLSYDPEIHSIGKRGLSVYKKRVPYWDGFMNCLKYPFEKETNPEGYIGLCLAENNLIQEELATRLMREGTAMSAFSESEAYCLQGFLGLPRAREALSSFLTRRFWIKEPKRLGAAPLHHVDSQTVSLESLGRDSHSSQIQTFSRKSTSFIHHDHIALGAGIHSLLSHLLYILCDAGDIILIPAPYYTGFDYAVRAIAQCLPFPVNMENPLAGPTQKDLDRSYLKARKRGKRVRVLLLTNPNDPLGIVYSPDTIKSIISWARKMKLHVIVDEVYALTAHSNPPSNFQSIIRVLDNEMGNDVHQLWGLSKDFGASGFRIGTLYSQNTDLLHALANLNIFSGVSHPMQMILTELLYDDDFVDNFLDKSREKLKRSYDLVTRKLDEMVIPYVSAQAGLFVYVDFSSLLPEPTFEGEAMFSKLTQEVARLVLTPGQFQNDSKPGMFRLCYSWVPIETLDIAMERLSYLVLQIRRSNRWDDLLQGSWKDEITKVGTSLASRRSTVNLSDMGYR